MKPQEGNVVCISNSDSALLLAPDMGGQMVRWRHRGEEIPHWPDQVDWSNPIQIRGGNPLLFPFIGRHFLDGAQGRWRDARERIRDLPQHGFTHQRLLDNIPALGPGEHLDTASPSIEI